MGGEGIAGENRMGDILYFVLSICISFYTIQPIGCNINNNKLSSVQKGQIEANCPYQPFHHLFDFLHFPKPEKYELHRPIFEIYH